MFEDLKIKSYKGEYLVNFSNGFEFLSSKPIEDALYIVDKNITEIYKKELKDIVKNKRCFIIEANESNKSLEKFSGYIHTLMDLGIKRKQPLVAIGGGIIQDITCFLASTLMRGLPWLFLPTTLLAQSDSCIGSKSSINSGNIKNILGTFTPPNKIILDVNFLKTLRTNDLLSGVGEMLKVHAINSPESFDEISEKYEELFLDHSTLEFFIYQSLLMKKKLIEIDEFDEGPRNVMNYGHSFGHAIESATNYAIPHGIAVTIGMDMANFVASHLGISTEAHFDRMHNVLDKNCKKFRSTEISTKLLMEALYKDKKNTKNKLKLILPNKNGKIMIDVYEKSQKITDLVQHYCLNYQG